MQVTAKVPVKLVNGLNQREHWAPKAKRAKDQRSAAFNVLMYSVGPHPRYLPEWPESPAPVTITITRRGGGRMDDDGLTASAKHVRDGIADWLGIDDGDPRLTWVVRQDKAPRGQHWVDIEVTA
jgi:hypothetical protein